MKTPDEIKIWLETEIAVHYHLPNPEPRLTPKEFMFLEKMHGETLAYIERLESRIAQVECERNAAVKDLADACKYCKHISCDDEDENSPCKDCMQRKDGVPFGPMIRTRFEWRGVCHENTKED